MTYPISASLIYKTDDLNVQIKIEVLELLGQAVYLYMYYTIYMIERPLPLSTMHCHYPPCTAIIHHTPTSLSGIGKQTLSSSYLNKEEASFEVVRHSNVEHNHKNSGNYTENNCTYEYTIKLDHMQLTRYGDFVPITVTQIVSSTVHSLQDLSVRSRP